MSQTPKPQDDRAELIAKIERTIARVDKEILDHSLMALNGGQSVRFVHRAGAAEWAQIRAALAARLGQLNVEALVA
jgi:hypothetical protein